MLERDDTIFDQPERADEIIFSGSKYRSAGLIATMQAQNTVALVSTTLHIATSVISPEVVNTWALLLIRREPTSQILRGPEEFAVTVCSNNAGSGGRISKISFLNGHLLTRHQ